MITIGRGQQSTLRVDDPLASREHARVEDHPDGLLIFDLNSRNGTLVNGIPRERTLLLPGDIVTIGNSDFEVVDRSLRPKTQPATLVARNLEYTPPGSRRKLLHGVDLTVPPGTLVAIIGPSGAGKSTLIKLLSGTLESPSVTYDNKLIHAQRWALRTRIGTVPQDDILHSGLSVREILRDGARLRLPPDTSRAEINENVRQVLTQLDISHIANRRLSAGSVSGGERKRISVALELFTRPSLLILDEPTSGLDPDLDHQMMEMLRNLADEGKSIIVVTHNVLHLSRCHSVVLIADGRSVFAGPPSQLANAVGGPEWREVFQEARAQGNPRRIPGPRRRGYLSRTRPFSGALGKRISPRPPWQERRKQFTVIFQRQVRILFGAKSRLATLLILPFVLSGFVLAIPGDQGLGAPREPHFAEPTQTLIVLIVVAAFLGAAASVRAVVSERATLRRDVAAGLDSSAYLFAKAAFLLIVLALQSGILVATLFVAKPPPIDGALTECPELEIFIAVLTTAVASGAIGLLVSIIVRSEEQALQTLLMFFVAQFALCGGVVSLGAGYLNSFSYVMPSRWGYAAAASTADIRLLQPNALQDGRWEHTGATWLLNISIPLMLAIGAISVATIILRKSIALSAYAPGGPQDAQRTVGLRSR